MARERPARDERGKEIFEAHSCSACHCVGGVGTAAVPALIRISAKFNADQLVALFKHPTAKMRAGSMPAVEAAS